MAYGLGAAGYALGLMSSAVFDLPSGAVIVWALAVEGVVRLDVADQLVLLAAQGHEQRIEHFEFHRHVLAIERHRVDVGFDPIRRR